MKNTISVVSRIVSFSAVMALTILTPTHSKATAFASCITNSSGVITFRLNESGGNVLVTYEDGSTNSGYDGITAGTNLAIGAYSFSLAGHSSYTIAVTKVGTGSPSLITNAFVLGNLRGIDVNKNPTSPYFGRVYFTRSSPGLIYALNSDSSFVSSNSAGVTWVSGNTSSPFRLAVAPDDYLMVGDYSSAGAAVWRIPPDLSTNQLFLGPLGDSAGTAAGVHGEVYSRPVITGSLANGASASLYYVDADFPSSQVNSLLIYNGITTNALPWQTAPIVGPEIGLNIAALNNVYPGLTQGPNGYIYASELRNNYAIPNVYVYDSTGTNLLWNSLAGPANTGPDYFVTAMTGGTSNGPVDSAVSPDGKYFATVAGDNHFTICSLTNGIPDVSTIYTVVPTSASTATSSLFREICWDAAGNLYFMTTSTAIVQEWTLGNTATAITTGNAGGTTGFQVTYPSIVVGLSTTNAIISQANSYGTPTSSSFTIARTGDSSGGLVVNYTLSGTAAKGTYTITSTNSITLAPGQTSTNIAISAVTDGVARATTSVSLTLAQSPNYTVAAPKTVTINILNTAPDQLTLATNVPSMYNAFSNDYASVTITRLGDTNAAAFTINNFTVSGTAVEGVDYTQPTPVTFSPGDTVHTSYIYPLINGQLPTHNNAYVGNKTVILSVGSGTGYTPATNTAVLTIIDSATPPAAVLFADPLTSASDATNWNVTAADGNMPAVPPDYTANFGYDLQNGDQYAPIPFPPSGASTALRVTVTKTSPSSTAPSTGVNLYLTNVVFSGDYAVRFNMNITEGSGGIASSSTEGPLFGINHNGTETNWWTGSGLTAGATVTTWASDGVWFWTSADGDASEGDYIGFTGNGGILPNTGWQYIAQLYQATFANAFKTNVFTSDNGPGLVANGSPYNYANVSSWSDVEIKQLKNLVTLSIDKTLIYVYTNTTIFTNGVLMLGYNDPFNGSAGSDAAVYFSNLRVVKIGAPVITQTAVNNANDTVIINFTSVDGDVTAASFGLQSSPTVNGPYSAVSGATITQLGTEAFQAVVTENGPVRFYRITQQ